MAHQSDTPTVPPPPQGKSPALDRNIAVLRQRARQEEAQENLQQRLAERITAFTGSMFSVYFHLLVFGAWIVVNLGFTPIEPWDPSFVFLAMTASVEAIFLSTFVLISQNRMGQIAERRAELDLQTSLLTEHEVTKLIALVSAIAGAMNISSEADPEVEQLKENVAPEAVLDRIEEEEEAGETSAS